jgi:hypothetical protein
VLDGFGAVAVAVALRRPYGPALVLGRSDCAAAVVVVVVFEKVKGRVVVEDGVEEVVEEEVDDGRVEAAADEATVA